MHALPQQRRRLFGWADASEVHAVVWVDEPSGIGIAMMAYPTMARAGIAGYGQEQVWKQVNRLVREKLGGFLFGGDAGRELFECSRR